MTTARRARRATLIMSTVLLAACSGDGHDGVADLAVSQDLLAVDTLEHSPCALDADTTPCTAGSDFCGLYNAYCSASACKCFSPVCIQGQDETCNDDTSVVTVLGHCNNAGACQCGSSNVRDPDTGKCAPPCPAMQPAEGSACTSKGQGCEYGSQLGCSCGSTYSWTCDFGP